MSSVSGGVRGHQGVGTQVSGRNRGYGECGHHAAIVGTNGLCGRVGGVLKWEKVHD